jgi:hypothetical protein
MTQATEEQHSARSKTFSSTELEWFSRNSYNLALELRTSSPLDLILRLLNVSLKVPDMALGFYCIWLIREQLIDLYPHDFSPKERSRICARRMLCDLLAAVIIIVKARAGDNPAMKVIVMTCH